MAELAAIIANTQALVPSSTPQDRHKLGTLDFGAVMKQHNDQQPQRSQDAQKQEKNNAEHSTPVTVSTCNRDEQKQNVTENIEEVIVEELCVIHIPPASLPIQTTESDASTETIIVKDEADDNNSNPTTPITDINSPIQVTHCPLPLATADSAIHTPNEANQDTTVVIEEPAVVTTQHATTRPTQDVDGDFAPVLQKVEKNDAQLEITAQIVSQDPAQDTQLEDHRDVAPEHTELEMTDMTEATYTLPAQTALPIQAQAVDAPEPAITAVSNDVQIRSAQPMARTNAKDVTVEPQESMVSTSEPTHDTSTTIQNREFDFGSTQDDASSAANIEHFEVNTKPADLAPSGFEIRPTAQPMSPPMNQDIGTRELTHESQHHTQRTVEQIVMGIKENVNKPGTKDIVINLHPAEMGKVEVRIHVGSNGSVEKIELNAANRDTLGILMEGADKLREDLKQIASSDGASLSFNLKHGNHGKGHYPEQFTHYHEVFAHGENTLQQPVAGYTNTTYHGSGSLNIMV